MQSSSRRKDTDTLRKKHMHQQLGQDSIMSSSLIDAYEQKDVVTIDIKGAFLKAKVSKNMELKVKMSMAELICELEPSYKMDEQGVMYLKCLKALYGHIEAARLFYEMEFYIEEQNMIIWV